MRRVFVGGEGDGGARDIAFKLIETMIADPAQNFNIMTGIPKTFACIAFIL